MTIKHWSKTELIHETVKNPNIHIRGTHSYYSNYWSGSFEQSVVRYHYGDEYSLAKPFLQSDDLEALEREIDAVAKDVC